MASEDRRSREKAAQRELIVRTARALAEHEGWSAVTTRRLSAEIEYSQPVIYKHFGSLDHLVEAVAREGFADLAGALIRAHQDGGAADPVRVAARAYRSFAADNPALYDAMFTLDTKLPFRSDDTPVELAEAFAALRDAVSPGAGTRDPDTLTEMFWAALHGLVVLDRGGRLRPGRSDERLDLLVAQVAGH